MRETRADDEGGLGVSAREARGRPRSERVAGEAGLTAAGARSYVVASSPWLESCGSNSVVECHLAKVDVEGSNPFSRSTEAR